MNSKYQSAGELIDFSIGGGWGKEEPAADYSNKVAIVRGADFPDVDNGIFDRIPVRWEKETKATKASLKAGDVILEISGGTDERPTGRTVRVSQELLDSFDCPVIPASFCRLVRPNEYVNSQYFYYWLQDMYAKGRTWNYQNRSTGLSNFQFKVFCEAEEVRVPSYNEQCAIAEVLCLIDKKRMANIKLNDYLAELLLALQKQIAETEELTESRADEVFNIHIGKTPPRKEPEWFSFDRDGNVIWMSIKDMGGGDAYLIDSSEYLTPEAVDKHNIKKCKPGSVLLSFKLTVGRVGIVASEMVTNEAIACFSSDDPRKLAYLYPLLKSYDYASLGSTSSIATAVNSKMIKAMGLKIPSSSVLDAFYERAKPIYELLLSNTRELAALNELRDTLLPKLMSGEIDVSDIRF